MKQGRTLKGLEAELLRQMATKKDYKAPAGRLQMTTHPLINGRFNSFELQGVGTFGVKETAHAQIGEYLEIPKRYYDRMREGDPSLLATNVNRWLAKKGGEARLVRTLDGDVRALLSDRYRQLDNFDLLGAVLPIFKSDSDFRVESCDVTEKRLYLQVVNDRITTSVKKGDEVQAGIVISNSEIGDGSLRIEQMVYRVVCTNGAISAQAIRKNHVGRAGSGDLDEAVEFYRTETRKADDRAFWMKVQDAVRGSFDETRFHALVRKMQDAAKDEAPASADLPAIVEVVATRYGFSEVEKKGVEGHFLRGGDFSRYGLLNAVTRAAQDVEGYDRAVEFERIGGDVLEWNAREWGEVSNARIEDGELVVVRR